MARSRYVDNMHCFALFEIIHDQLGTMLITELQSKVMPTVNRYLAVFTLNNKISNRCARQRLGHFICEEFSPRQHTGR